MTEDKEFKIVVGNPVKVRCKFGKHELPNWSPQMDKTVGQIGEVTSVGFVGGQARVKRPIAVVKFENGWSHSFLTSVLVHPDTVLGDEKAPAEEPTGQGDNVNEEPPAEEPPAETTPAEEPPAEEPPAEETPADNAD